MHPSQKCTDDKTFEGWFYFVTSINSCLPFVFVSLLLPAENLKKDF